MTVSELRKFRKKGQIIRAARDVAKRAKELCPAAFPDISATSLDGSAPDDVDLLMDIFNVPDVDSHKLREGLREVSAPYLMREDLMIAVILHSPEDTEKYYADVIKRIQSVPEAIRWLSECYDTMLRTAS